MRSFVIILSFVLLDHFKIPVPPISIVIGLIFFGGIALAQDLKELFS
jgi:hypothetical protein